MSNEIYTLSGEQSQLILSVGEVAEILYYGKKLHHGFSSHNASSALRRAIPYGRLDVDVPVSLNPQLARGSFGSPGLEGHCNGLNWSPEFKIVCVEQKDHQIVVESCDERAKLKLTITLKLDQYDVLQVSQTLNNYGDKGYSVTRFANTVPLPERANEVLSYFGRWVKEFQQTRTVISAAGFIQENRRGRTSHEHYPALMLGKQGFSEQEGEVWGAHLAWSGNHRMRVDVKADGRRLLQAEALYLPGEIYLQPQQSITTPTLYMSYSNTGLNGMSDHFHQHVRHEILGNRVAKPRPVHLNTWEGIYFQHDPDYIMQMATEAAAIGVERFIVDDGWFKGRNDDTSSLGDWFIDADKYPNGIAGLIDHVHQLGMEFGLWFEPEMINKHSDLYSQHLDWLLAVADYDQPTGRHQYALDLQNPKVSAYLFERLDHFLSQYDIDYVKWDMNREIVQPGHNDMAAGDGQVHAYYELVDKLVEKHPDVDIESCAAGGGRIDYEVLKRTHRFWASDNNDALERQQIQKGMSYFFPPEVMGAHIGAEHSHTTRRTHTLSLRGITALFGHMGLELDPVKTSDEDKRAYRHYVSLHKQWRPLLHTGRTYRLTLDDECAQQGVAVVAPDQSNALVSITQLAMSTYSLSGVLRIPGLNEEKLYRIDVLDKPALLDDIVNCQPEWMYQPVEVTGEWLAQVGIAMPLMDPESAVLLAISLIG
ncbi:alpha-galactosidase [Vibrio sp. CAIM 722]|uniref:Alpha-galactosidase n=1 Tax=Vibrio eleionomae TaxID=2653505 RepID=A0A7X4LMU6_9VIBR|nr:alpha-galactosidase [Vibrio eleionomae]MZI94888.1 alpha-galactosidase [Vibrio eleionomae]